MLTLKAPSSKSVSHRMLMGAALAGGLSTVRDALMSKDIERTMAVLSAAGASFTPLPSSVGGNAAISGTRSFSVQGMQGRPLGGASTKEALSCDMHESGTSCRLLTAILAAGRGHFRIHGAPRLHQRPLGRLTDALQSLGVSISFEATPGCPPLHLESQGFQADAVDITLEESSQYLSGLLLAAPLSQKGLTISLTGEKVLSWPYVSLTLQAMEDFGLRFVVEERHSTEDRIWRACQWRSLREAKPGLVRFKIYPGAYKGGNYTVEGDWSGASYFLAAGVAGRKPLRLQGLRKDSLQGDRAMLDILLGMGADITFDGDDILLAPSPLRGVDVDMGHCPDLVPTVAFLAAFARGATRVRNVAHLRIKESDRIAAPAAELRKVDVRVEEHEDGLTVHGVGRPPRIPEGTLFHAHGDHRIAMSAALLSLHGQEVILDDPTVVGKSFPHFWQLWERLRP